MNEIVKKNGIKFGLISGLISILSTSLIYALNLELFGSMMFGFGMIAFYIALGVFVVSTTKKELKGIISFKEAFTSYFLYALIGVLIANFFNYILFNFIDAGAKDQLLEITMRNTVEIMEKYGSPKDAIAETVKKLQENDQFSIGSILKGSVFSVLFSSIIGLIIAAIFKTKTKETF
jgi:hypothetical protein